MYSCILFCLFDQKNLMLSIFNKKSRHEKNFMTALKKIRQILLSRTVTHALPSVIQALTSLIGMERVVTLYLITGKLIYKKTFKILVPNLLDWERNKRIMLRIRRFVTRSLKPTLPPACSNAGATSHAHHQ